MSKVAVLKPNVQGEGYQVVEWAEYDGSLTDYLSECEGELEICARADEPVIYNSTPWTGVVLRGLRWDTTGEWYHYEIFCEEAANA